MWTYNVAQTRIRAKKSKTEVKSRTPSYVPILELVHLPLVILPLPFTLLPLPLPLLFQILPLSLQLLSQHYHNLRVVSGVGILPQLLIVLPLSLKLFL